MSSLAAAAPPAARQALALPQIVVMGVSGCGKSTVAAALAEQLGLDMVDGDDLHLSASVAKMRSGIALQDDDRWPWLDCIGEYLSQPHAQGRVGGYLAQGLHSASGADSAGRVVACSALKRSYRDRIRSLAPGVQFVFLDGDAELIYQRMSQRQGHYMQPGLLASQLQTLEKPLADERDVFTLDLSQPVPELVRQACAALKGV